MLKNSALNAKIGRPIGSKKIENPTKVVKSLKHEEVKEQPKIGTVTSGKSIAATRKIVAVQETKMAKTQSKTQSTAKQGTVVAPTNRPKFNNLAPNKAIRSQPMKAVHQIQVKKPVAEKNVMNTIHNVTIASPPSVRKELFLSQDIMEPIPRERTKTHTLEPEEVLILKHMKPEIIKNSVDNQSGTVEEIAKPIKEAIAFEINFEKAATSQTAESQNQQPSHSSDGEYEDDFDSYESDFESGSSSSSRLTTTSSAHSSKNSDTSIDNKSECKDFRVTEKKLDKDRDFDSGTYELKGVADKLQLDSIDERESHSEEQNDSGFGYSHSTPSPIVQTHLSTSYQHFKPPIRSDFSKRGLELMKKINLDTMTFTLFELKPISYELYMRIYGQTNANQSSSQTIGNTIDQDVQTDTKAKQSMWTQFPPSIIGNTISNENYHRNRLGCGEGNENETAVQASEVCVLEKSLKIINKVDEIRDISTTINIDYEMLNIFLQKSAITISGLLSDTSSAKKEIHSSDLSVSDGFFEISSSFSPTLDETAVYYVYSNSLVKNFLYLVYRKKFLTSEAFANNSFVSMWNVLDMKKPIYILSCWSSINCLEVHQHFQDVVIGGLSDGSLSVWNLTESKFWHHNIDEETLLAPTQIISPSVQQKSINFDFGGIIALKSVYSDIKIHDGELNLSQIASLHEFGILTVWTILYTNSHFDHSDPGTDHKIDHRSPWSKVQLVQSNIIEVGSILTKRVRPKSGFEKKKMYFESNLFSDVALRELHQFDSQMDLLDKSDCFRCVDMEYHDDAFIVATNKSFLLSIGTSLSKDSVHKLFIDENNFLHATKLKSMDEVLLVALTNGSVKVLRVKQSNICRKIKVDDSIRSEAPLEENNFSAKSCAIQNIIKEERKFFDDEVSRDHFGQVGKLIDNKKIAVINDRRRFINNQLLLPAASLNRDFVRWLDVSVKLNCLIGLCGDRLRILNFHNLAEIREDDSPNKIICAAILFGHNEREYLVTVADEQVRVHFLRKKLP